MTDRHQVDLLYRRHLLLTVLGGALALAAVALVVLVVRAGDTPVQYVAVRDATGALRMHAQRAGTPLVLAAAWVGLGVVGALFLVVVGHAVGVATFTFRPLPPEVS